MTDELPSDSLNEVEQHKPENEQNSSEASTSSRPQAPGHTEGGPQGGGCITPTSSGEDLSEGDYNNIVIKTLEMLRFCQIKVDEHTISSRILLFILLRIRDSLEFYFNDYIAKLNTFLVEAERITGDYYVEVCCTLPMYGDYERAIEAQESTIIDLGDSQISKYELGQLVKGVRDNYFLAAKCLKSIRIFLIEINSVTCERLECSHKIIAPLPDWLEMHNFLIDHLGCIRYEIFQMSAYLDFMKHCESNIGNPLDVTPKKKTESSPVKIKQPKKSLTEIKSQPKTPPKTPEPEENQENKTDAMRASDESDDIFDPRRRIRTLKKETPRQSDESKP